MAFTSSRCPGELETFPLIPPFLGFGVPPAKLLCLPWGRSPQCQGVEPGGRREGGERRVWRWLFTSSGVPWRAGTFPPFLLFLGFRVPPAESLCLPRGCSPLAKRGARCGSSWALAGRPGQARRGNLGGTFFFFLHRGYPAQVDWRDSVASSSEVPRMGVGPKVGGVSFSGPVLSRAAGLPKV